MPKITVFHVSNTGYVLYTDRNGGVIAENDAVEKIEKTYQDSHRRGYTHSMSANLAYLQATPYVINVENEEEVAKLLGYDAPYIVERFSSIAVQFFGIKCNDNEFLKEKLNTAVKPRLIKMEEGEDAG